MDVQLSDRFRWQRIVSGHGGHARLLPRGRRAADAGTRVRGVGYRAAGNGHHSRVRLLAARLHGDPGILGKAIRMSRRDTPPTVVRIMAPRIRFLPSPAGLQEPKFNLNAPVHSWVPRV